MESAESASAKSDERITHLTMATPIRKNPQYLMRLEKPNDQTLTIANVIACAPEAMPADYTL